MLYRRFGRTNIQMPVLSTGGMRYNYKWQDMPMDQIPADNQANLEATIHRSLEVGINHIETARGYGTSERQLGEILPKLPREKLIIQTKVAPEADPQKFRENFLDSLQRLKLDFVELFSLHGVNNDETYDWSFRKGGCMEEARKLQREGLCKFIGFSTHGPCDLIKRAVEFDDGEGGIDYVNLHYYYISQRNRPAIDAAMRLDKGVFIISPSDKGGKLYSPPERVRELCAPLHPMEFNDIWTLAQPGVHTLSLGSARPSDYDEHLSAIEKFPRHEQLLPPIIARWEAALRESTVPGLDPEFLRRYEEGLPDWADTPGNVNIPIILWLFVLAKVYDMVEYATMRYNLLGNGGHWFPGLNAGALDTLDLKPALANSPYRDRIPELLREAHALLYKAPVKRLTQD